MKREVNTKWNRNDNGTNKKTRANKKLETKNWKIDTDNERATKHEH